MRLWRNLQIELINLQMTEFVKKRKDGVRMNAFDYVVARIDGDYAYLKRIDEPSDEEKIVARALLPQEIAEGTKLHYEFMMYSIVE